MGYAECNMDSRIGSVSSGLGCSRGMRGQPSKSSPFCPPSSSKLTQSIIKDHMVSHYKKVYSAKDNDRIRQERLRKGGRPHSAHSLSQRDSRASCSSAQSRLSVQYDDSPYLCSRSSLVSSPRFGTSFHAKEIVYPSRKVGLQNQFHRVRPASEVKQRSPDATSHRMQSACSLDASGDQSCYKTFQDPVQKTYSGDLIQKHSQHFTQDKPFTPKTLKTDKNSYLSNYRYYRAPRRKPTQDCTQSRLMRQETYHGSTKTKECTQESHEPSQGFNTEHEWSEDESNGTYFSSSRQQSRANKSRDRDFFDSSSRVSPEGGKSPTMKNVSSEEEELMYLEFISAVTEDILSRGHISDRVLDRVIKRHIDMNRHHLHEGKMHHLLEVLRKDFEETPNTFTCSTEFEKKENGLLDTFLPNLEAGEKQVKTKENNDLSLYASLIKDCDSLGYADPLMVSTPLCSPERFDSPTQTTEKYGEDDNLEKGISSPGLSEHVSNNAGISEEDFDQNQIGTTATNEVSNENHENASLSSDKGFHQELEQAEVSYDGQSKELEDLGRSLSKSLHVTSNTHYNNAEATEQHTAASVSDDEF
ncbi:spermatogenesis-associated protein 7 isoform X2 [Larimichthys crocea]|uniref:spermatogenesis-associated protein 7 isoform X2 n=1 Tax=Larimichthys crocea TaxID=215358 RepID=UPI000F5EBF14|nr:spermatogenesis-associated protein 7 isoform X2 [Larimichthys crocea]